MTSAGAATNAPSVSPVPGGLSAITYHRSTVPTRRVLAGNANGTRRSRGTLSSTTAPTASMRRSRGTAVYGEEPVRVTVIPVIVASKPDALMSSRRSWDVPETTSDTTASWTTTTLGPSDDST